MMSVMKQANPFIIAVARMIAPKVSLKLLLKVIGIHADETWLPLMRLAREKTVNSLFRTIYQGNEESLLNNAKGKVRLTRYKKKR